MTKKQETTVEGRRLTLTNLDKILWPDDHITKAELIHYYLEVYPFLAPHLVGRPLVVTRYPDGIHGQHFYQRMPLIIPRIGSQPVPFILKNRSGL